MDQSNHPKPRGFALMHRDLLRKISQQGGYAAHDKGVAHEFTVDEARAAGRLGGIKVSSDRARMAAIGRLGGLRTAENKRIIAAEGA